MELKGLLEEDLVLHGPVIRKRGKVGQVLNEKIIEIVTNGLM